jgi:ribosomal-protein-serine acetyltransferase
MKLSFPSGFPGEIRPIQESNTEELFSLVDRNRQYLRGWLPWLDGNTSLADSQAFIHLSKEQHISNRGFQAGAWYKGELAGIIGYHPIDWQNRIVMIGYWLGQEYQGKGIMSAACRSLTSYAFDEYNLNRVEIKCATGNAKSCAIPERLGFTKEGIIREGEWLYDHFVDLVIYSMLARQWKDSR